MIERYKAHIAAAVAAVLAITFAGSAIRSHLKLNELEGAADEARRQAEQSVAAARERELAAAGYAAKIAYLEQRLAELQTIRRKQDEELENLSAHTGNARAAARRTRGARAADARPEELCRKLSELGHGCGH